MKKLSPAIVLSALALLFIAMPSPVRATLFEWSYTFSTGEKSFGTIEATKGDTYLEDFSYVTFQFQSCDGRTNRHFDMDSRFLESWPQQIRCDGSMVDLEVNFENDTNGLFQTDFGITKRNGGWAWAGSLSTEWLNSYDGPEVFYGNPGYEHEWQNGSGYYPINYRRSERLLGTWSLHVVSDNGGTLALTTLGIIALGAARMRSSRRR